jgi:hypothetical protein
MIFVKTPPTLSKKQTFFKKILGIFKKKTFNVNKINQPLPFKKKNYFKVNISKFSKASNNYKYNLFRSLVCNLRRFKKPYLTFSKNIYNTLGKEYSHIPNKYVISLLNVTLVNTKPQNFNIYNSIKSNNYYLQKVIITTCKKLIQNNKFTNPNNFDTSVKFFQSVKTPKNKPKHYLTIKNLLS